MRVTITQCTTFLLCCFLLFLFWYVAEKFKKVIIGAWFSSFFFLFCLLGSSKCLEKCEILILVFLCRFFGSTLVNAVETAIDKWDLKSERNINYRSFEPIFRLAEQYENPICQRWACWALANLTTVYRKFLFF